MPFIKKARRGTLQEYVRHSTHELRDIWVGIYRNGTGGNLHGSRCLSACLRTLNHYSACTTEGPAQIDIRLSL